MPENQTSGRVYRFGEFLLLADERMVMRSDERVHMTPRVFHLLLILVENAGRLVSKETLLNEIWQDSFVEEGNLNSTVSRLRKILGETPDEKRFIETIPRVGYRFIADVEVVSDDVEARVPSAKIEPEEIAEAYEVPVETRKTVRNHRFWLLIPVAAVLLLL